MSFLPSEEPKTSKSAWAHSSSSGSGVTPPNPPAPPVPAPAAAKSPVPPVPAPIAAPSKAESAASGMLSSLRVSLMPNDLEGRPAPNFGRGLIILFVTLLVETAIVGGSYLTVSRSVDGVVAERAKLAADIQRLDKETAGIETAAAPAVAYAYQVRAAGDILDKHVYWSPFFAFLEKSTLPSVKYLNFAGDATTGTVTVDCIAGTYHDVAEQIVSLRESPMILDVRSNSAAAKLNDKGELTGIAFGLVLKLKPDAWSLISAPAASSSPTVPATDTAGQAPAFMPVPSKP